MLRVNVVEISRSKW